MASISFLGFFSSFPVFLLEAVTMQKLELSPFDHAQHTVDTEINMDRLSRRKRSHINWQLTNEDQEIIFLGR